MKNKISNIKAIVIAVISIGILVFLDQITKIAAAQRLSDGPFVIINNVFEFRYINNHGAAWGILSGQRIFFIITTIIVITVISLIYWKTPKNKKYFMMLLCEILLCAGAIGNFIDRVLFGYVRDFIYFSLIDFPIFNIADCYVVISAVILCILVIFVYKDEDFDFLSLKK